MRPVLAALLLLCAAPLAAQNANLTPNGEFDADFVGWTVNGDAGAVSFDPAVDSLDIATSGSVRLADPSVSTQLETCVPTNDPALRRYTIGIATRGDSGAFLDVTFFSDANCLTASSSTIGLITGTVTADFRYRFQSLPEPSVPAGGQSVRLRFGRPAGAGLENNFDQAFLVEGLPEDSPPFTSMIDLLAVDGLTVDLAGLPEGGYAPFPGVFSWDFGDGAVATGDVVSHTYASPGTYLVTLNINRGFEQTTATIEVTVEEVASVTDIPTLGGSGLILLGLLLASFGVLVLRRT